MSNNVLAKEEKEEIVNSLSGFVEGLYSQSAFTPVINQLATAQLNNRYDLVFNNRQLLNQLYIEHGIIQTLVDMPVDDAYRNGFKILSKQLSEDDIEELEAYIDRENIMRQLTQAMKWARLFGGGGLVIITNQPADKELDISKINEFSTLEFYPADLWELNLQWVGTNPSDTQLKEAPYMFYGQKLHKTRVLQIKGKESPSLFRNRMRGWGMSEVERVIRSFNQYIKYNNVIFELLDEAKVDVYKIDGFNSAMATAGGTDAVTKRIQASNMVKSYLNALTMDTKDEYDQKQMTFSGLADMLVQIRYGIASDLKMPVSKLFGVSSTGFNSGEDDIENYNSMVEHEVRAKTKFLTIQVLQMVCAKLFGFIPDDLTISFESLRVLSSEQEEAVKNGQFNRIMQAWQGGLMDTEEAKEAFNKNDLVVVNVNEKG